MLYMGSTVSTRSCHSTGEARQRRPPPYGDVRMEALGIAAPLHVSQDLAPLAALRIEWDDLALRVAATWKKPRLAYRCTVEFHPCQGRHACVGVPWMQWPALTFGEAVVIVVFGVYGHRGDE